MPRLLLLALSLSLFGCASTQPPSAPARIPPRPVALLFMCPAPEKLPEMATENELAEHDMQALRAWACERSRSMGFMEAWPK